MLGPIGLVRAVNACDDDVTNEHADGTNDKESLATELVEEEHGWECKQDLEDTSHTGGKEGDSRRREAKGAEDLRCVVENGIDSSELLEDHDPATDSETLEDVGSEKYPAKIPGQQPCNLLATTLNNSLPWCKNTTLANLLLLGLAIEENGRLDLEIFGVEKRVLSR